MTAAPNLAPVVTIKLASTSDELLQCFALRAAVFMGEQQCPYEEEFDGNDYTATHVVMYVDGEPAGTHAPALVPLVLQVRARVVLRRYRGLGIHHADQRLVQGVRPPQGLHQGLSASARSGTCR